MPKLRIMSFVFISTVGGEQSFETSHCYILYPKKIFDMDTSKDIFLLRYFFDSIVINYCNQTIKNTVKKYCIKE